MNSSLLVCSVMVVDVVMFFMLRLKVLLVGEKLKGDSSMIVLMLMVCWMVVLLILCMRLECWKFILLMMLMGWVVRKLFEMICIVVLVMGVLGRFWLNVVLILKCSWLVVFWV